MQGKRTSARWRFAGGVAIVLVAVSFLTRPASSARTVGYVAAILAFYVGVVICLRAGGILRTDHSIRGLRARWVVVVFVTMLVVSAGAAGAVASVAAVTTKAPKANEARTGCNGYFELCAEPFDQIVWPASHNAMSSSAYNFLGAEHTITIPEQLIGGARFLMLDVYYGYDDNGLVRTNLAGGIDREKLVEERGQAAVDSLQRIGALTGTADTSGHKQELYFCHDLCELGAVKAVDVFREIKQYLDRNLTDFLVLDFEDYVQPKDLKAALQESGLYDRIRTMTPEDVHAVPLGYLLAAKKGQTENPRRVLTVSEKHGGVYDWLPATYSLFQETPYTFSSVKAFSCAPKRGKAGNPMFLINHWLRPDGPPDPGAAADVNSRSVLLDRYRTCAARREVLPNVIAVDFTEVGALYATVRELNSAIATADRDDGRDRPVDQEHVRQRRADRGRGAGDPRDPPTAEDLGGARRRRPRGRPAVPHGAVVTGEADRRQLCDRRARDRSGSGAADPAAVRRAERPERRLLAPANRCDHDDAPRPATSTTSGIASSSTTGP